ncbi:MAG: CBS domain-containing protein [Chloroflexi bacterium]|nr:CBS domain-containing protein [Chloroflexota bacterium]
MTRNVVWVTPDISLPEVSRLLAFHNVSGFPVCDDEKLVGMVSEADVIWKVGSHVREIMSEEVIAVLEDTAIDEIARVMSQHKIKRVPVLRNGELVGIVSRADLVRAVAERA